MIFAFQAYKQQFLDAATRLVEFALKWKLLDVPLNRIADIALAAPEHGAGADPAALAPLAALAGAPAAAAAAATSGEAPEARPGARIELRSVRFRYGLGEPEVLAGVDLVIAPGELVALVGPSGGGKTTLLKLMMGLVAPTSGEVLVDGRPLAGPGLGAWRRRIGSVAQDDRLYAGSLAENIAFFDPAIDLARVVAAARSAAVHEAILAMPMGYETLVGDMGSALSGGQKQRVLLARALYVEPAALFIDEGTAHLDPAAEAQVLGALAGLAATRVVSAHRPAAIAAARRTLLVAGGTVRELAPGDALAAA